MNLLGLLKSTPADTTVVDVKATRAAKLERLKRAVDEVNAAWEDAPRGYNLWMSWKERLLTIHKWTRDDDSFTSTRIHPMDEVLEEVAHEKRFDRERFELERNDASGYSGY